MWSSLNYRVGQNVTKFGIFQTPPEKFLLSHPNAAEYCNSEKKLVKHRWLLYTCATFGELWPTNHYCTNRHRSTKTVPTVYQQCTNRQKQSSPPNTHVKGVCVPTVRCHLANGNKTCCSLLLIKTIMWLVDLRGL